MFTTFLNQLEFQQNRTCLDSFQIVIFSTNNDNKTTEYYICNREN